MDCFRRKNGAKIGQNWCQKKQSQVNLSTHCSKFTTLIVSSTVLDHLNRIIFKVCLCLLALKCLKLYFFTSKSVLKCQFDDSFAPQMNWFVPNQDLRIPLVYPHWTTNLGCFLCINSAHCLHHHLKKEHYCCKYLQL